MYIARVLFVALAAVAAIFVPQLTVVFDLIGSTVAVLLNLVIPMWMFFRTASAFLSREDNKKLMLLVGDGKRREEGGLLLRHTQQGAAAAATQCLRAALHVSFWCILVISVVAGVVGTGVTVFNYFIKKEKGG